MVITLMISLDQPTKLHFTTSPIKKVESDNVTKVQLCDFVVKKLSLLLEWSYFTPLKQTIYNKTHWRLMSHHYII